MSQNRIPITNGDQAVVNAIKCLTAVTSEMAENASNVTGIENGLLSRCYQNGAGETVDVEIRRDEEGLLLGYTIHSLSGTVDVADLSSLTSCPASTSELREVCYVDDVNGDGTLLVPFTKVYELDSTNECWVFKFQYPDSDITTKYTVLGVETRAEETGAAAQESQNRIVLENGAGWIAPALTTGYTIKAINADGGTFTDSEAVTTPLINNDTIAYNTDLQSPLKSGASVTTGPTSLVVVEWTTLTA